jgi:flavin-dependent dehydrogenase
MITAVKVMQVKQRHNMILTCRVRVLVDGCTSSLRMCVEKANLYPSWFNDIK